MRTYPHTIDNGRGERLTFTVSHDTDGPLVSAEGVAQPGAGAPMHVHYLQTEAVEVVSGLLGYQNEGGELAFAGPGEVVVWPAGTPHRWWNAGRTELRMTGWCQPPNNVEFYLTTLFASMKANGNGRPDLFDMAFLATRYRTEFAVLELPTPVRRFVMPAIYTLGRILGKYERFRDAPAPIVAPEPCAHSVALQS